MHKFFAKTLFLGKNVVFLPQCHSTNEIAKELARKGDLQEGTIVWSDFQENGKGQQSNVWLSERGKNLLFTCYIRPEGLAAKDQFRLNMLISIVVLETLKQYLPEEKLEVKWPNDIYCNGLKIAGILVETVISGRKIEDVFIGVGLNVNQSHFSLPTATSIRKESGKENTLDEILESILLATERYYEGLNKGTQLESVYLKNLRWLDEEHVFEVDGVLQKGTIIGINEFGKLKVNLPNGIRNFDLKEIRFVE